MMKMKKMKPSMPTEAPKTVMLAPMVIQMTIPLKIFHRQDPKKNSEVQKNPEKIGMNLRLRPCEMTKIKTAMYAKIF